MKTNNIKILWWVIALLVVLNVSTIATILYHNYTEKRQARESVVFEPDAAPMGGRHFRQTLNLDDSQMDVFRAENHKFRSEADRIIGQINVEKERMLMELRADNPDTVKLNAISARIGELHKELKVATFEFYLSVKEICNEEQCRHLQEVFTPLFKERGREGSHGGVGRGQGRGQGKENKQGNSK